MSSIRAVLHQGQSIWLDFIRRNLITSGEMKKLIEEGVRGLTSNPSIFQKAICESNDYITAIQSILLNKPDIGVQELYERLAIEDIQLTADVLRPVYDESKGDDGYVSLEASPYLANDTKGTIAEVRRLWRLVNRPNLMVKVPGTAEGILAIETLIAEGININITLLFSLKHYEAVANAYIKGLAHNNNPLKVASVASFFVSRIDTVVDKALEKIGSAEALKLRGKAAVACSKAVYRRFGEMFYGEPFSAQRERGARLQRPLWGSTSTKNPAYSDVLYVEELIGPDTVNTVPLETLIAFRDHGRVRPALLEKTEDVDKTLANLKDMGINLDAITEQLQKDGVAAFAKSFDQLLAALKVSCQAK